MVVRILIIFIITIKTLILNGLFIIVLLLIYSISIIKLKPYRYQLINKVDLISSMVCIVLVILIFFESLIKEFIPILDNISDTIEDGNQEDIDYYSFLG